MARKTHANDSNTNFQEDLVLSIKCISSELRYNRHEFVAFSHRADRLFSILEAKARRPNLRVDPPKFNGDDPSGWIYKVQSYFDYFQLSKEDRLRLVALLFEHPASNWLLYQHENSLLTSWPNFLEDVKRRFDPPRVLKVTGTISGEHVQTLISGGSTHNFIHPDVVKKFQLQVTTINPFCVHVANQSFPWVCGQKCKNTKLSFRGHEIVVDLFVFHIDGPDVVLGASWLKSLGEINRNYDDHMMDFRHKDKVVTLRGVWEDGRQIIYNAVNVAKGYELLKIV